MSNSATIKRVDEILPIEGANAIELCVVGGWQCVVKKGEFRKDDLGVFIEIDSVVPDWHPYFEFMKSRNYRVKTIRLRGQLSQGLMCPLSILENLTEGWTPKYRLSGKISSLEVLKPDISSNTAKEMGLLEYEDIDVIEGADVSIPLGVKHYEKPEVLKDKGQAKGFRPSWFPKTDEERVQNLSWEFTYLKDEEMVATEKLDGSSVSGYVRPKTIKEIDEELLEILGPSIVINDDNRSKLVEENNILSYIYGVTSRNLEVKLGTESKYELGLATSGIPLKLPQIAKELGVERLVIQGELVGEGIQKNPYNLIGQHFYCYQFYLPDAEALESPYVKGRYMDTDQQKEICGRYGIAHVPEVARRILVPSDSPHWIEVDDPQNPGKTKKVINSKTLIPELLKEADDKSLINPNVDREGIVWRTIKEKFIPRYGRASFKCVSNLFLEKNNE